jgi:hypothetical protein
VRSPPPATIQRRATASPLHARSLCASSVGADDAHSIPIEESLEGNWHAPGPHRLGELGSARLRRFPLEESTSFLADVSAVRPRLSYCRSMITLPFRYRRTPSAGAPLTFCRAPVKRGVPNGSGTPRDAFTVAAWPDTLMQPYNNTHYGRYSLLVLSLRSRMASLTIRRKTTPVRGWDDSSPFLAAARTALRKSPIGASFKINRLTPCLTSSRTSSCSVAPRRFRLRARDAYFTRCVFTCRCLNATCQRHSWPRSIGPIEDLQIGFGPPYSSGSHLPPGLPAHRAPLAT